MNATSKDVQKAFKKHCAAKLAAVAADATAALPGPSTTEPAKRRMRVEDNSEEGPQMKRRRRN